MTGIDSRAAGILREALDREGAQRAAFVEQACVGDAVLLATLHRLLNLEEIGGPLLGVPFDQMLADVLGGDDDGVVDHLKSGDRMGPWRLIERIGSGGMGSVWQAQRVEDEFTQRVALKTIKLGMDSAAILTQFRRERAALARLQHPHIAHLIDGGIDARGRPWFAMELVDGVDLNQWLKSAPPLRTRLQLFVKLCRAVAYAHRQLVVHRDLKPSNVSVQADGEPRLLDFGIAKLLENDADQQVVTVQRFVSRGYAAPEQLRGEAVTTATDVYALGVLLFELLTGLRYATFRRSDREEPTRPSHAVARDSNSSSSATPPAGVLRGDLDAIALRALADDPQRRYGGADEMADDVERYLAGRVVRARPDGAWYRLRKLVSRNRAASAALLVAVLALASALAVSVWQTHRAEQHAARAVAVKNYLIGLFDSSRNSNQGMDVRTRTVGDMLEQSALNLYAELKAQPDVRDEIYTILVEIFDSTDQPEYSLSLARERAATAVDTWGENDARTAPTLVMLAGVLLNHDQLDDVPDLLARAERMLDAARDRDSLALASLWRWQGIYKQTIEDEHPDFAGNRLHDAVALLRRRYPDSDELLTALYSYANLAIVTNHPDEAEQTIAELRRRALVLHGAEHLYVIQADFAQAKLDLGRGQPEKAYQRLSASVDAMRHFAGDHHHDVLGFHAMRVRALVRMGRLAEARQLWLEADALRRRVRATDEDLRDFYANLLPEDARPTQDEIAAASEEPSVAE